MCRIYPNSRLKMIKKSPSDWNVKKMKLFWKSSARNYSMWIRHLISFQILAIFISLICPYPVHENRPSCWSQNKKSYFTAEFIFSDMIIMSNLLFMFLLPIAFCQTIENPLMEIPLYLGLDAYYDCPWVLKRVCYSQLTDVWLF